MEDPHEQNFRNQISCGVIGYDQNFRDQFFATKIFASQVAMLSFETMSISIAELYFYCGAVFQMAIYLLLINIFDSEKTICSSH